MNPRQMHRFILNKRPHRKESIMTNFNNFQSLKNLGYTDQQISEATYIALEAASDLPPSYFSEGFTPHEWVVLAVLKAQKSNSDAELNKPKLNLENIKRMKEK